MTALSPEAHEVVAVLTEYSYAIEPLRVLSRDGLDRPGMYSWWGDQDALNMFGEELGVELPPLLYIGQAGATKWPSGKRSRPR